MTTDKKDGPSEEALEAFYQAVLPALIRIAKKDREKKASDKEPE